MEENPGLVIGNEESFIPKGPPAANDDDDDASKKFQSSQPQTSLPNAPRNDESGGGAAIKSSFTLEVDPCLVSVNEQSFIPRAPRDDDENANARCCCCCCC